MGQIHRFILPVRVGEAQGVLVMTTACRNEKNETRDSQTVSDCREEHRNHRHFKKTPSLHLNILNIGL